MKTAAIVLTALVVVAPSFAQNTTVQMQCHPLSSTGGYLAPDETAVNGMACKPVQVASTPTPQSAPQPAPAAQPASPTASSTDPVSVYFYRPRRFQGAALKPSVFVDDARVGNLHNGDSIKITVSPGVHRIYSTDKSTGLDLNAQPGVTYYVRVDIQTGFWKGHGGVTLVDPQQGMYEVAQAAHSGGSATE
jgi:hypothetical protein